MTNSFEKVFERMCDAQHQDQKDLSKPLRKLDPKQRKALELFSEFEIVTSRQIGALFGFKRRTSSQLCKAWCKSGFLKIVDPSNKGRKYRLAKKYQTLIQSVTLASSLKPRNDPKGPSGMALS